MRGQIAAIISNKGTAYLLADIELMRALYTVRRRTSVAVLRLNFMQCQLEQLVSLYAVSRLK